ncbi:TetR/AcrR family transcriptional regulator [Paenibacillus rhizoplanae]
MNLREKQQQLTRSLIKDTALELFCTQGIERTDMTQIAGQAGVSRRTLYLHYKDKEDLAAELYVDNLEQMFGQLLFDFDFAQPVQSLEKILDQYLELREHQESLIYYDALFGVYYSTLSKNPAELPDFRKAMEVWYSRYISLESASVAPEHQKVAGPSAEVHPPVFHVFTKKAVILSHQRGGAVTEEDRATDRQFKDFIMSGVRAT